jgi:hypothetical protein
VEYNSYHPGFGDESGDEEFPDTQHPDEIVGEWIKNKNTKLLAASYAKLDINLDLTCPYCGYEQSGFSIEDCNERKSLWKLVSIAMDDSNLYSTYRAVVSCNKCLKQYFVRPEDLG